MATPTRFWVALHTRKSALASMDVMPSAVISTPANKTRDRGSRIRRTPSARYRFYRTIYIAQGDPSRGHPVSGRSLFGSFAFDVNANPLITGTLDQRMIVAIPAFS